MLVERLPKELDDFTVWRPTRCLQAKAQVNIGDEGLGPDLTRLGSTARAGASARQNGPFR